MITALGVPFALPALGVQALEGKCLLLEKCDQSLLREGAFLLSV